MSAICNILKHGNVNDYFPYPITDNNVAFHMLHSLVANDSNYTYSPSYNSKPVF